MRKVIQLIVGHLGPCAPCALCDDGTMWFLDMMDWKPLPDIPQDEIEPAPVPVFQPQAAVPNPTPVAAPPHISEALRSLGSVFSHRLWHVALSADGADAVTKEIVTLGDAIKLSDEILGGTKPGNYLVGSWSAREAISIATIWQGDKSGLNVELHHWQDAKTGMRFDYLHDPIPF